MNDRLRQCLSTKPPPSTLRREGSAPADARCHDVRLRGRMRGIIVWGPSRQRQKGDVSRTIASMTTLRITNDRVIDPAQNIDRVADVWLKGNRILAIGATPPNVIADRTLDATGLIVAPGLIDMHVHLREPGREEDETIQTGTAAALAGGFTSVACIPNTEPPIDTQATVEFVRHQAAEADNCNVFVVACVSKNREGKELAELGL